MSAPASLTLDYCTRPILFIWAACGFLLRHAKLSKNSTTDEILTLSHAQAENYEDFQSSALSILITSLPD